jgi:hypothetical protein
MSYNSFADCYAFTRLNIGSTVQYLNHNAFHHCITLSSIYTEALNPPTFTWLDGFLTNVQRNIPVYIPCFTYNKYTTAYGWNEFTNIIINGTPTVDTTFYSAVKCYNVHYTDSNFTTPIYQPGIYYTHLPNAYNCDSIICLNLTQYPYIPITNYSASYCQGGSYTDDNFTNLTQTGYHTITLTTVAGCDSIVRLYLTVTPAPTTNYSASICQGGSYTDDNFTNLTEVGTYQTTLQTQTGCDSIVNLTLHYAISLPQQLCMITVDEQNHNMLVWKKQEEIGSFNIYREETQIGVYELAATIDYNDVNSWVDIESNARIRSYRYKIAGIDTCGNVSELSSAHKTMHLTINAGMNNSWNLIWTAYEGTEYSAYNIYRARGTGQGPGQFELIATIPGSNTSYSDFFSPAGNVYYMIEIMLSASCDLGKSVNSIKSNIATNALQAIDDNTAQSNITIYPNPTTGELRIECGEWEVTVIMIFDIYGRVQNIESKNQKGEILMDISELPVGVYFLRITTEQGEVVRKVVKE